MLRIIVLVQLKFRIDFNRKESHIYLGAKILLHQKLCLFKILNFDKLMVIRFMDFTKFYIKPNEKSKIKANRNKG
ncbi:hypothetical protein BpHYR1_018947 [Brachionus plicatilis]|uniref:Uncharacterized protein n=1 Tax=Brachionus plicatilis TaxID=10195 RepID=A0A3M7PUD2_BRAPC|nr:hypothetical protein BpHYR1_018947 [Brachionus plicatilis]